MFHGHGKVKYARQKTSSQCLASYHPLSDGINGVTHKYSDQYDNPVFPSVIDTPAKPMHIRVLISTRRVAVPVSVGGCTPRTLPPMKFFGKYIIVMRPRTTEDIVRSRDGLEAGLPFLVRHIPA
jgi:hypothetical protein